MEKPRYGIKYFFDLLLMYNGYRLEIKNNIANTLCEILKKSRENAVSKSNKNDDILHPFILKKKYETAAFDMINIGCASVFQYDDIDPSILPSIKMQAMGIITDRRITPNLA